MVITANNGPARLLRNDGGNRNHYLRVRTVGTTSNRDGIGARVTVALASGQKPWHRVRLSRKASRPLACSPSPRAD